MKEKTIRNDLRFISQSQAICTLLVIKRLYPVPLPNSLKSFFIDKSFKEIIVIAYSNILYLHVFLGLRKSLLITWY